MSNKQEANSQSVDQSNELDFEAAMNELETLVSHLESGDLPLEISLQEFEKGIQLSRRCQKALNNAEQRVKILLDDQEQDFQSGIES